MPKIDVAKRRRIMQRSQALGHCVCDPRRPCPCDVFTQKGICPCAGERPAPAADLSAIRLTELVHNAGCASKIAPADLEQVLSRLPKVNDPAIHSGIPAGDDAGIYQLTEGVKLVQTVDVFTPCVDDAETFGRICAANCLSDIYAMGATPRTALSILCFPSEKLDGRLMYHMMKGAMDTLAEAGVALIGGHSIKDEEIKLGFAITGTLDGHAATENSLARPGDLLVLTKPLGTGVLCFARQIGRTCTVGMAAAQKSMATLNKAAAEAAREAGVVACTDITGFGLLGHLALMTRHSRVTADVWADALPAFPEAIETLEAGVIPGSIERNSEFVGEDFEAAPDVPASAVQLGFDSQTSGGLLLAVPAGKHARLLHALKDREVTAATVGRIVDVSQGRIRVVRSGNRESSLSETKPPCSSIPKLLCQTPAPPAEQVSSAHAATCCDNSGDQTPDGPTPSQACCAGSGTDEPTESIGEAVKAFGTLMRATACDGAVDARTKELINFALVVYARCTPCLKVHVDKARKMGITPQELDEAAWCAIAMGGAPVKMFYQQE